MGACTRRLYLSHDGQHIGREGVRRLPVCRHALRLRIGEIGPVPKNGALRPFFEPKLSGSGLRSVLALSRPVRRRCAA